MKNRVDLPDTVRARSFSLQQGEHMAFRSGQLLVVAWRAKGKKTAITMITSASSARMVEVPAKHRTEVILKPACVDDYNQSMNGVDRSDQYTVSYPFIRRTRKWWRKLFFYLVEVSVVNSYILYKQVTRDSLSHLDFRRRLLESLAEEYMQREELRHASVGRPRTRPVPTRLDKKLHLLAQRQGRRDCVVCSDRSGSRHNSQFYCKTCPDKPALHPTTCFERFHTMQTYKM